MNTMVHTNVYYQILYLYVKKIRLNQLAPSLQVHGRLLQDLLVVFDLCISFFDHLLQFCYLATG